MLCSWEAHFGSVTHVAFTDDSEAIVTGGADASVLVFDVGELVDLKKRSRGVARPRLKLHGHSLPITGLCVGFGGSSARVLTAAADRTARMWHLASATCIGTVILSSPVADTAITPDETAIFLGLSSGAVLVVAPNKLSPSVTVSDENLPVIFAGSGKKVGAIPVTALALSPLGCELVVGFADGAIRVIDIASRIVVMTYSRHNQSPITWLSTMDQRSTKYYLEERDTRNTGTAAMGLLFEGTLAKVVENNVDIETSEIITTNAATVSDPTWAAIDCALQHLRPADTVINDFE